MTRKWISMVLCVLIACVPACALAEDTGEWEALLSQALGSVEALTAPEGTLRVEASASVNVVPDMAYVTLGMSVVNAELSQAQNEANAIINRLIEALKELGVEENDIVTNSYNISPQRDYSESGLGAVTGYYVSNNITVTLSDFALLDTVIDTAVQCGVNEVYGMNFDVKDRSEYYRQALANAVAAGQEKAELLARSAGVTLGALTSISEESSVSSYYAYANTMDSVAMAMDGETSIQGGELNVMAKVELVYSYKVLDQAMEPIG